MTPKKDVEKEIKEKYKINEEKRESVYQHTLSEIYKLVGEKQLIRYKMEFAPSWTLYRAFQEDIESHLYDKYDYIHEHDVKGNANLILSHVVHKVKNDKSDMKRINASLFPKYNLGKHKQTVTKESVTASV